MDVLLAAAGLVFQPYVLLVIVCAAAYGLFVGSMPGLTATMATALLVPVTFFMEPLPAIAAIVTASAMAIFAGDIPGALLRIPGTPASAAYAEEAYAMTRKGEAERALGASLTFSVVGGLFGSLVLIFGAPALAEVALNFSSYEYFWLVCLGLTCAVFVSSGSPLKGAVSLILGLLIAGVGIDNPAGFPRFTFGVLDLMSGVDFIAAMIGLFAVSQVIRTMAIGAEERGPQVKRLGSLFGGQIALALRFPVQALRGSAVGTLIGTLPGAGGDIAAWVSYAVSKKASRTPERFGTGHPEGIVESGASNNAAISGTWIPTLVFGIPGDSITAVVIGVLYLKGLNPGPTIFVENAELVTAVFLVFILANLLLLPLGWIAIKSSTLILRVPRRMLMPVILLFCIVGAFAINNSLFAVYLILGFGLLGYLMEENGFPIAPMILGIVLGGMLERHFVTSMIKAGGDPLAFFERPIAGVLGVVTLAVWLVPAALFVWRTFRKGTSSPTHPSGRETRR